MRILSGLPLVFTVLATPGVVLAQVGAQTSAASGAQADQAAPAAADEVVVTSRKLGERAIDAPASIAVFTAAALAEDNITNANQLNGILPGLVQAPGSGGGGATGLRGLGSSGSTFSVEASVAEYIDGVYLGHYRDYIAPLYDIDRIEVLKGTQSTLLGKNASVGAISIVTNKPTADTSFAVNYTYSDRIDGNRVDGFVNTPVAPDLFMRAAFFYSKDDGYYDNAYTGGSGQTLRDASGRLELAYAPADAHALNLLFTYEHDDRHAVGQNFEVLSDGGGVLAARALASGQTDFHAGAAWTQSDASAPLAGTPAGQGAFDDQKTDRLNMVASTMLGPFKLTSQTSYVNWRTPQDVDLDFLAANFYDRYDVEKSRTFSQEFRAQTPEFWRTTWLFGLYAYDNQWDLDRLTSANPGTIPFPLNGYAHEIFHERTLTGSAFGSLKYRITDQLTLVSDFRYTNEDKLATISRTGAGNIGGASGSLPPIPYTVMRKAASPLDSDVALEYRPLKNTLFYITYGKGSKSGGFQEGPKTAAGSPFAPETAYSAETGVKVDLGGRGAVSAALFDTEVHSFQVVTTSLVGNPPVSQSTVGNADVRSRGFELSGALNLLSSLKLDGGLVYDHATFTQNFLPVAAVGDRLVKAPVFSGQAGLTYHTILPNGWRFEARPDLQYASSALTQPYRQSPDAPISAAHDVFDLRLTLRDPASGLSVSLLATNLNDARYVTFASAIGAGGSAVGQRAYYGSYDRPRVIGVRLTYAR